jgi:hypothetical protein
MKTTLKLSLACLFIALDLLAPLAQGQGQDILAERDRYMENVNAQCNELDVRLAKLKIRYDKLESCPQTWAVSLAKKCILDEVQQIGAERKQLLATMNRDVSKIVGRYKTGRPLEFETNTPKDCVAIATEAYPRLKNTNYWSGIASFTFNKGGNSQNGYAVALFQPTKTSNVWLYDATGSRELTRTSHDLNDIAMGINLWLKGNYYVSGLKWIDQ